MDLVRRHPRCPGRSRLACQPAAAYATRHSPGAGRCPRPTGGPLMIFRLVFAAVLATMLGGSCVLAVEPSERLADPALEARARALSKELRCLVCQNQSIDESNADLAHDLRILLRQRLVGGDSD